jgi:glycosyltransferase involved in cell wall biosynthesis
LLAVGRLAAQKDHATLIDAFAQIADSLPDWDLRIVGEGELRATLEAAVARHALDARVQLPGNIKDISREYLSAQLFVMPSLYESQGLATEEALAHGLPAVGFADCPGTNTLIKPGCNGVLVDPGRDRARSLAATLRQLMEYDDARSSLVPTGGPSAESAIGSVLAMWEGLLRTVTGEAQPSAAPTGNSDVQGEIAALSS